MNSEYLNKKEEIYFDTIISIRDYFNLYEKILKVLRNELSLVEFREYLEKYWSTDLNIDLLFHLVKDIVNDMKHSDPKLPKNECLLKCYLCAKLSQDLIIETLGILGIDLTEDLFDDDYVITFCNKEVCKD